MDIEVLYRKYAPMVMRRCLWILKDRGLAEDAMQETFVKLIRYQERLKADYPSSLLYTMATNVCLSVIRKHKRRAETMDDEILESVRGHEDIHSRVEAGDMLDRIFREENESTRVMATLHYLDGMTYSEVAQAMGMSVSGVRKRLRVLRENLQESREQWNENR